MRESMCVCVKNLLDSRMRGNDLNKSGDGLRVNTFPRVLIVLLLFWPLPPVSAAIVVADDTGQEIKLSQPAQRIVSLAPNITELVFAAGAGDRLVGVSEYSDYPEAARSIRRIGGGNGIDLEAVVALAPDLVIAWQSGNPSQPVKRLRELGLKVFISEPRNLTDITDSLRRFGRLAGTGAVAARQISDFERRYEQLSRRYSGREPVSVFYQVWEHPLMTVNGQHLISDVIRLCGGRNVFAELPALAPQISTEAVLAANPEVIVSGGGSEPAEIVLARWQRWPGLAAAADGHLFVINRDLMVRHTPRILQGAEQLCSLLDEVRAKKALAGQGRHAAP
jgi:iron complex transport system substrate-binding protein